MLYCSTCGYPAPCGRCEDSDNPSARIRAPRDNHTLLTDIRCGCGGLCDSREVCSMRGNVQACSCGYTTIVHTRGQSGCRYLGGYHWQTDPLGCNGPLDD